MSVAAELITIGLDEELSRDIAALREAAVTDWEGRGELETPFREA